MSVRRHHRCRRFLQHEDGSITVEFVVTFPLILAALAFSFEFGRLFIAHHTLVNNVRSAERYLSRCADPASNPCNGEAINIVRTGVPSGGSLPVWASSIDVTITPDQSTFDDTNFRTGGQVIRVDATANYQFLIANFFGGENGALPIAVIEDIRFVGD